MNSPRVSRLLATLAPTLTSATFVPKSLPEAHIRNSAYGVPQGRIGSVVSRIPVPGTITTSCRRTQAAVRNTSMPLPRLLSAIAVTPDVRSAYLVYHCSKVASIP